MKTEQVYRSYHLFRKLERNREEKKNKNLIKKNKNVKILVILHLFYPKSWKEIKEYLENLSCYEYDLIVTYTKSKISQNVINKIKNFKYNTKFIGCENKGFDLRPFLIALKNVDLSDYDIVFKLQSKSTKRSWIYIYDQLFMRRDWFLDLFEGVLSAKVVHRNIDLLYNDKEVGLVAADNLIVNDPLHKIELVQRIAKKTNLKISSNYKFVAGTCFAIKSECLSNIQSYPWIDNDFKTIPASRGMSFAHFFERYICAQVESKWGKKLVGVKIRNLRHKFLAIPGNVLYHFSSNRLFNENIDFDPEFFYWLLDNRLLTWKYKNVAFKDIKYINDEGTILPFLQNAPYQYLKYGDLEAYKKYCEYHKEHGLPLMSADRFQHLKESIDKNGYDERHLIILDNKNILIDGQHRACCLCEKMGENALVKVLVINILEKKKIIKSIIPEPLEQKMHRIKQNIKNK